MMSAGMGVLLCGATMRKISWEENQLLPDVTKSSMKALSALKSEAGDILTL